MGVGKPGAAWGMGKINTKQGVTKPVIVLSHVFCQYNDWHTCYFCMLQFFLYFWTEQPELKKKKTKKLKVGTKVSRDIYDD